MLSILTAAETEMYESSKKNEETQQLQRSQGPGGLQAEAKETRNSEVQTIKTDDAADSSALEALRQ